ncbi:MAG: porin [Bacteroidota bacterium]
MRKLLPLLCTVLFLSPLFGKDKTMSVWGSFGEGVNFMPADSSFSLKMRVRFQTQANGKFNPEPDPRNLKTEAFIRRMRLRFEGFALHTSLQYKVQLNGSNDDMESTRTPELDNPGILRDAVLQWTFMPGTTLWFGQTKLPGNRERVVSSANQEFVDRSNLNRTFTIDRDIGIQLHHQWNAFGMVLREQGAISTGEGRNRKTSSNGGVCMTVRGELLPLGQFEQRGDYIQGDLVREKTPKVSLGYTYSYNKDAIRTGGQLGEYLYNASDIETIFADVLFKYQGFSFSTEYSQRSSPNPISTKAGSKDLFIYDGNGTNSQLSYMLTDDFQLGLRYTQIQPSDKIDHLTGPRKDYVFGLSKYLHGHDLKIQADINYINEQIPSTSTELKYVLVRVQTDFTF